MASIPSNTDALPIPAASAVTTYPPGATYGPRRLRDYEFVWITEGQTRYTRNGEAFDLEPGAIVLCQLGWDDHFRWDTRTRSRHAFVHFDLPPGATRKLPPRDSWPVALNPREGDLARPLFRHVLTQLNRGNVTLARESLMHLLRVFVSSEIDTRDLPPHAPPEPVVAAMRVIRDRLDDNASSVITFAELVRASGVSGPHLCRLFRNSIGHSPIGAVRAARLDRAAALVTHTNFSFKQIAEQTGFVDQFHFSRRFRSAFGMSPRAARESARAGTALPLPTLLRRRS